MKNLPAGIHHRESAGVSFHTQRRNTGVFVVLVVKEYATCFCFKHFRLTDLKPHSGVFWHFSDISYFAESFPDNAGESRCSPNNS